MENKKITILTLAVTVLLLTIPLTSGLKTSKNLSNNYELREKQSTNLSDILKNLSKPMIRMIGLIFTISAPIGFIGWHLMLLKQIGGYLMTYGLLFLFGLIEGFLLEKPLNESLKMGLLFSLAIPAFFIVSLKMSINMFLTGEFPDTIGLPEYLKDIIF